MTQLIQMTPTLTEHNLKNAPTECEICFKVGNPGKYTSSLTSGRIPACGKKQKKAIRQRNVAKYISLPPLTFHYFTAWKPVFVNWNSFTTEMRKM